MAKLLFLLMIPALASGQVARQGTVLSGSGRPVAGASIWVCTGNVTVTLTANPPCTPAQNIYTDYAQTHLVTQPLLTDGLGNYLYYTASGTVTEVVTGPNTLGYSAVLTLAPGNAAIKPAASDAWYYVSNTGNVNNDGFSWGSAFPTISQAETACGSNPCTIWVSKNYTGAESPNLITTNSGYKVYGGATNITIIDLRANVATPGNPGAAPQYPIGFSGRQTGQLTRFFTNYYSSSPADSTAGSSSSNWFTGAFPSTGGSIIGANSNVWVVGSISGTPSIPVGQDAEAEIDSTTSITLPTVIGSYGAVNIPRTDDVTSITNAVGVRGGSCTNSSTSGGAITNCYGVEGLAQTLGTARNYSFHSPGNFLFENGASVDAVDSGGTPRHTITFNSGNVIIFQPLSDVQGWIFENQAGQQILGLSPNSIVAGSSVLPIGIKIASSGGGFILHQAPNTASNFTITDPAATGISTVSNSCGTVDLMAQGANIGSTTLCTPSATGFYRASCYVVLTRAATTSSTLPSCSILWTDADSNALENFVYSTTSTANVVGTVGSLQTGNVLWLNAKSGQAIQYTAQNYASSGATTMQYAIHVRLEGPF